MKNACTSVIYNSLADPYAIDLPEVLAVLKAKYLHNLKASKGGVDLQRTVDLQRASKPSKNDPHQGSFYTMFWHFYDMFEDKTSFATLYVVYVVAITFFTLTLINFATPERAENALAPKSQATENYLDWDKNEHLRQELKAKQKELYKMLRTKDTVDMKVEKLQKEVQLLKQQKTW
uniref:Secreted protein n=1 Tax=Steinernema glaseri TaxID=37863 RepID=A0A1I7YA92_9BILA